MDDLAEYERLQHVRTAARLDLAEIHDSQAKLREEEEVATSKYRLASLAVDDERRRLLRTGKITHADVPSV